MKRNIIRFAIIVSMIFGACSVGKKKGIVIFDAASTPHEFIFALNGGTFEKEDSILAVRSRADESFAGIVIRGNWDLTPYNQILVELKNFDQKVDLPVTIRLENPDADPGKGKGVLIDRLIIPAGSSKQFTVSNPPRYPYPEIAEKLTGMRNTPYKLQGLVNNLDPQKVTGLAFYINNPRQDWNWGVKKVTAVKGVTEPLPAWMQLSPDQFFPFIDEFGQFIHKDWPGKTKSVEEMKEAIKTEAADLEGNPGPAGRDQYGGWADGPKQKATGEFYVKKIDGKWWMVDPEGNLYWSHGAVRVTTSSAVTPLDNREFYFKNLPGPESPFAEFYTTHDSLLYPYYVKRGIQKTYDFSAANLMRKYGENWREIFGELVHKRLRSWGLTTIANSSDLKICHLQKTPYCDRFELKSPDIAGSHDGWWKFKDPFHPEFRTTFSAQLTERKRELADPWCLGFFVDNEIAWGGPRALAEWTLQSPAEQPAKQEMVNWLKKKYKNIGSLNSAWNSTFPNWDAILTSQEKPASGSKNDCVEFTDIIANAYFKNIREEFKKAAPGKLYMGCRFAGSANENILRIAAKYCDVLSYNIYRRSLADFKLPEGIDKPVMIGEFHFGALDRGLFHPGQVKTENQQERGEAYAIYVESALRHPNFIGTHWHQYSDQATTGRFDGENFQVGFTDVCDKPYPETIAKIREVGYKMYEIRSAK